jgi:alpha-tubulin suppressor-like RCC1 family protein
MGVSTWKWKQISLGNSCGTGIKEDGTLWLLGRDIGSYGILGTAGSGTSSPVSITGGGTNWKQVDCGSSHNAAIKTDGTLWSWGYNLYGQLGDGTTVNKSSPVSTVIGGTNWKQVAAGGNSTVAVKTDGTLWTWGYNLYGQLGDGTTVNKSSPVSVAGGGTNWKQVAAGGNSTVAVKTDGTLWTWGYNLYGQLGDGTTVNKSSPVSTVIGGTDWKFSNIGGNSSLAIKTDGTLWTWGRNSHGQLGDGTAVNKSSPVFIFSNGITWKHAAIADHFSGIGI